MSFKEIAKQGSGPERDAKQKREQTKNAKLHEVAKIKHNGFESECFWNPCNREVFLLSGQGTSDDLEEFIIALGCGLQGTIQWPAMVLPWQDNGWVPSTRYVFVGVPSDLRSCLVMLTERFTHRFYGLFMSVQTYGCGSKKGTNGYPQKNNWYVDVCGAQLFSFWTMTPWLCCPNQSVKPTVCLSRGVADGARMIHIDQLKDLAKVGAKVTNPLLLSCFLIRSSTPQETSS